MLSNSPTRTYCQELIQIIENFDYQAAALALQTLHYKNELIL